ncbi:MAG TPA: ABC transporter permease subunit, partial [Flavisolibacter sp.]|nr:ABC transporter permease subunit [Flavisolibacter sp.]
LSSWFIFIPAVVVIMFITNEYTYKTYRQNIIDGWSRKQFMTGKLIDVGMVALLITILFTIVSLVIGFVNKDQGNGDVWGQVKYIGLFFLQTFSQLSLAFLIAFLARKAFIALGIFLFYYLIIENVLVALAREKANDIGRYLPFEISDRLIPIPAFMMRNQEQNRELQAMANVHVFYTLLLIALTWGFCYWRNSKRDL